MSWCPAIGPRLAGGKDWLPAHVVCDGCEERRAALTQRGDLPMWLLKGKAPPGWLLVRREMPYHRHCRRRLLAAPRRSMGVGLAGG